MKETIRIDYPATKAEKKRWTQRYGMNAYYAGKHWAQRKQDAEFWHALTREALNRQRARKQPFQKPVTVTFWWNDRLDIDNHAAMGKMIVDALKGRLIEDDNRQCLKGVCHYWHDENYIKIVVEEVS